PAVPAVHLPEVDDARPVAGRTRLLPDADERAAVATPCSPRGGMSLVRFRTGADDVDRLVEVEPPVRHAARHSRAAGRANSRAVRAVRPVRMLLTHEHVDDAHAAAAHHVAEADARVLHLPPPRLAAQLERGLPDLGEAGRPAGVAARDEPAVGRHRHAAARRTISGRPTIAAAAPSPIGHDIIVVSGQATIRDASTFSTVTGFSGWRWLIGFSAPLFQFLAAIDARCSGFVPRS